MRELGDEGLWTNAVSDDASTRFEALTVLAERSIDAEEFDGALGLAAAALDAAHATEDVVWVGAARAMHSAVLWDLDRLPESMAGSIDAAELLLEAEAVLMHWGEALVNGEERAESAATFRADWLGVLERWPEAEAIWRTLLRAAGEAYELAEDAEGMGKVSHLLSCVSTLIESVGIAGLPTSWWKEVRNDTYRWCSLPGVPWLEHRCRGQPVRGVGLHLPRLQPRLRQGREQALVAGPQQQ